MKQKSQALAANMNKLTEKFSENLDAAEELHLTGDDIIDYVDEKTEDVALYTEEITPELINLQLMIEDFKFVRETLKENTENGRRVLNSVTLDLLNTDDDKRASLIMSFAELNKAVALNMKLYLQSYKDVSSVLLNLDKITKAQNDANPQTINNTLNIPIDAVSTVDLIRKLTENK